MIASNWLREQIVEVVLVNVVVVVVVKQMKLQLSELDREAERESCSDWQTVGRARDVSSWAD